MENTKVPGQAASLIGIRDASPADFPAILALNLASESFLSPLSLARLEALHRQAWLHRVACVDATILAFLLVLPAGVEYDSPNYGWFAEHYADFIYIDRIVVGDSARQAGLASRLYQDLVQRGRSAGIELITCEFDTDPPNEASRRFHARFGFVEVGSQQVGAKRKWVSLQALRLET